MGLFGSYLGAILGGTKKASVPTLTPLDLSTEQQKAAAGNIAVAPDASRLANLTSDEMLALINKTFPGFGDTSKTISKNIQSEVEGKVPADVQAQLALSDAGKSLASGTAGSGMARNLVARDFGLTSLDLTNRGLSSAESWLAASERLMAPAESVFTGMFVSPGQQASFDVNERDSAWNVNWLKSQIDAMPDPQKEALGEFVGGIGDAAASMFVGSAATASHGSQSYPSGSFGGNGGNIDGSMSGSGVGAWSGAQAGAAQGQALGGGGGGGSM